MGLLTGRRAEARAPAIKNPSPVGTGGIKIIAEDFTVGLPVACSSCPDKTHPHVEAIPYQGCGFLAPGGRAASWQA